LENNNPRPVPSSEDVRHFLATSRASSDARASAATSLVLSLGFRLSELSRLKWTDLQLPGTAGRRPDRAPITLPDLAVRQLLALQALRSRKKVFESHKESSEQLSSVLDGLLKNAGLSNFTINDFARWSDAQTPAVRKSVATTA
jgi:integrase